MHALGYPFKPPDHSARPRWLRHVRNHATEEGSSIFDALKLFLKLKLPLHVTDGAERRHKGTNSGKCAGWMTSLTLLSSGCVRSEAMLWALAFPWWSSRPLEPVFGRRALQASKTSGRQVLEYHSALAVFLSRSGVEATLPNLAKKIANICLKVLLDLLNFTAGISSGKSKTEDCCWVSGSYWYTRILVTDDDIQDPLWPASVNVKCSIEACAGITPTYPSSVPLSAGGAPYGRNASVHPGDDGGSDPSSPLKYSNCHLSQFLEFVGLLWLDTSPWPRFVRLQRSQGGHNGHCLRCCFVEQKFCVPVMTYWSNWRPVLSAVLQTFEVFPDKTSPDDDRIRPTSLPGNLSVKVCLQCRENRHTRMALCVITMMELHSVRMKKKMLWHDHILCILKL